ncbi:MAG: malate/lactate/ureidoglycolate dehydrogenase [Mobilicoccus sp.]|nr:malate/lactate/ureidoglycolate dehydrogenase [Mobilicoccus sp.]
MTQDTLTPIPAEHLHEVTVRIWRAAGGEEGEAGLLADHLVGANLAGHDSHGVGLIPEYVQYVREGGLVMGRRPEVVHDTGVVVTLEAGLGLGQVAAHDAMTLGIERAGRSGAAVVALRHSHHVGRIGHWAEQCAAAGFASLHLVSVPGDLLVAPFGGSDARFGTNPFCAAFPRPGADPILADFATSRLALGKMRVAHNAGTPAPDGTMLDAQGRPTTDPGVMFADPRGALLTTGEHKGSALAIIAELFAGAMAGGGVTSADTAAARASIVNAMFSLVIDPAAFGTSDAQEQADTFLRWVAASPPTDSTEQVLLPGEPERRSHEQRTAHGVPVDPTTWQQILDAGASVGLDPADLQP